MSRIPRRLAADISSVDTDILKPDTGALTIERPMQTSSKGTSEHSTGGRKSSGVTTPDDMRPVYAEPVSEGEEDEAMDLAPGMSVPGLLYHTHLTVRQPETSISVLA